VITLTIKTDKGAEFTRSWQLFRTNAPAVYDYGYTVELYRDGDDDGAERAVLLEVEREHFQRGRYASGFFRCEREEDDGLDTWAMEKLVKRALECDSEAGTNGTMRDALTDLCNVIEDARHHGYDPEHQGRIDRALKQAAKAEGSAD
jgi:hypothetical protein